MPLQTWIEKLYSILQFQFKWHFTGQVNWSSIINYSYESVIIWSMVNIEIRLVTPQTYQHPPIGPLGFVPWPKQANLRLTPVHSKLEPPKILSEAKKSRTQILNSGKSIQWSKPLSLPLPTSQPTPNLNPNISTFLRRVMMDELINSCPSPHPYKLPFWPTWRSTKKALCTPVLLMEIIVANNWLGWGKVHTKWRKGALQKNASW